MEVRNKCKCQRGVNKEIEKTVTGLKEFDTWLFDLLEKLKLLEIILESMFVICFKVRFMLMILLHIEITEFEHPNMLHSLEELFGAREYEENL
jgi:hypothetical protein